MSSTRLNIGKRELTRRLRDEGFEYVRKTGSHIVWKNWRLRRTVSVPDHGEIRGEIRGDIVKRIYDAAGWSWSDTDALMKGGNPPSPTAVRFATPPPTVLPTQIALKKAPNPIMPTQQELQTMFNEARLEVEAKQASQQPIVVSEIKEVPKETTVTAKKKIVREHKDEETVELIALACFEDPKMSVYALSKKWKISTGTATSIRTGHHRRLVPRTKTLLRLAFGDLTPAGAPEIVQEFMSDPKNIPDVVKRKLSRAMKKTETPAQLTAPKHVEAQVPRHGYVAAHAPQHAMIGYTPEGMASAPVNVGSDTASLQEMIDRIRHAMFAQGITKMTIPARGDVVVQRREILR